MESAVVSSVAQTTSLFSHAKSQAPPRDEKGSSPPGAGADATRDGMPVPVDRVSISSQSRQEMSDVKKKDAALEEAKREKVINEDTARANNAAAKVQFVYDLKGELSIRYMDTADRVVYQSPSELMQQMKEAASKSDSSVDTRA